MRESFLSRLFFLFKIDNIHHSYEMKQQNIVFYILDVGTLLAFDNENFITTCKFDDGKYLKKQTLIIIIFIEMIVA